MVASALYRYRPAHDDCHTHSTASKWELQIPRRARFSAAALRHFEIFRLQRARPEPVGTARSPARPEPLLRHAEHGAIRRHAGADAIRSAVKEILIEDQA